MSTGRWQKEEKGLASTQLNSVHKSVVWFTRGEKDTSWVYDIYSTFQTCQKLEDGVSPSQTEGQLPGLQESPWWGFAFDNG